MRHHNGDPDLLTIRDVARHVRVDDTIVRRWIKQGVLEAITFPHCGTRQASRLRRAPLEALLSAGYVPNEGTDHRDICGADSLFRQWLLTPMSVSCHVLM